MNIHDLNNAASWITAISIGLFSHVVHAQFSVDKTALDFGKVEVGSSAQSQTFTLTNVSSGDKLADLGVRAAHACPSLSPTGCFERNAEDAASFRISMACSLFVEQGKSCRVEVKFAPLAARELFGVLDLGTDITGREVTVRLQGAGVPRGSLSPRLGYQKSMVVGGALYFAGSVARDWSKVSEGKIRLVAKEIRNLNKSRASGPMRFQAVVSTSKHSDFSVPYFVVASVNLDALPPDGVHREVDVLAEYHAPPPGDYYLYYVVAEFEGAACEHDGYCIDDDAIFGDFSHYDGRSITALSRISGADLIGEAVEFYHEEFDHYFITPEPGEMALLDLGQIPGWRRTGESFPVWRSNVAETAVCRFFSASFAPKSSHFYTPYGPECEALRRSTVWVDELTSFYVTGGGSFLDCRWGVPLYRLYNNGMGGAPNHRFTISVETRDAMVARGWISEGSTSRGIIACTAPD